MILSIPTLTAIANDETAALSDRLNAKNILGLAAVAAKLDALNGAAKTAPAVAATLAIPQTYTTRTGRDAKTITNSKGKPMVFLNIRHEGEYVDLIVSGKHADAAGRLGEGSRIQYECGPVDRKPAVKNGAPVISDKTGQQIVNLSVFADHFKIIEAESCGATIVQPKDEYADFGAPRREREQPKQPTLDAMGFPAQDDIPF